MINDVLPEQAHQRERLAWQCRRGMRELDELLLAYLRDYYQTMDAQEFEIFNTMLACQDQKLLAYLMLDEPPPDPGWADVISKIRRAAAS